MGFIHDASAAPRPSALSVLRKGEALGFALAAFLLSLAVTVPTLGRQSLWYDEVLTANVVATGWSDLIADRLGRGHFPTYFMLLKSLGLGGASEAMLRLPSALFMSLAAAVMTVLALRLGGRIAALATLLLFAFMPALVYYGQEARPYAMLLFFLAIATMPLVSLVRGTGEPKRLATAATIGTVGAALAIPAGIASVLIMHLSLILSGALRLPSRFRRPLKLHVAVTWIVIGLAALTEGVPGLGPATWLGTVSGLIGGTVLTFLTAFPIGAALSRHVGTPPADERRMKLTGWSLDVADRRIPHFLGTHAMQALPLAGLVLDAIAPAAVATVAILVVSALYLLAVFASARLVARGIALPDWGRAVLGRPLNRGTLAEPKPIL